MARMRFIDLADVTANTLTPGQTIKVSVDGKGFETGAAATGPFSDADIAAGAAIAFSKLAGVASAAQGALAATAVQPAGLTAYATTAAVAAGYQPLDTQLTDLAALAYAANALKVVRVNAAANGLELTTPAAGGSATITATTATLPYGASEGTVTVTDVDVKAVSRIMVAWGNCTDTDENGPDMDSVSFSAIPGVGSFALKIVSDRPIGGAFKINYMQAA